MLACAILCLVLVALTIHHTCFSIIVCHTPCTWNTLDLQGEQVFGTIIQHYYLLLTCVPHIHNFLLCAFQAPHILQISIEKDPCNFGATSSQVSQPNRRLPSTACVGKILVRLLSLNVMLVELVLVAF